MTDVAEVGTGGMRNVGARVFRSEDPRILTGRGHYIDDLVLPNMFQPSSVLIHIVSSGTVSS